MKSLRALVALVLCLGAVGLCYGQAGQYRIVEIRYEIKGLVIRPFLAAFLGIGEGVEFVDMAALQRYRDDKDRLLKSNTIFNADASVEYELLDMPEAVEQLGHEAAGQPTPEAAAPLGQAAALRPGEPIPVRLLVRATTGTTMLIMPLPKYSTGDGFSLGLRYKEVNFLGTLQPFSLDFDYFFKNNKPSGSTAFSLYPKILGSVWGLSISGDFSWQETEGFRPNALVSFSSRYPFSLFGLGWYASPYISYQYEWGYPRHTLKTGAEAGFYFQAWMNWVLSTSLYFRPAYIRDWNLYLDQKLTLSGYTTLTVVPYWGALSLSASLGGFATLNMTTGRYDDAGPSLGLGLSMGRVDLRGNMRRGGSFSFNTSFTYHALYPEGPTSFDWTASTTLTGYYDFHDIVGVNFRVFAQWLAAWTLIGQTNSTDWQPYVRGVKNAVYGDIGAIVNLEFPINVAQGKFFGIDKLEAEVFAVPFIDFGYVRTSPAAPKAFLDDALLTAGMDLIIYPAMARAFTYRLSVGYDLMDLIRTGDLKLGSLELWLGLGLHF